MFSIPASSTVLTILLPVNAYAQNNTTADDGSERVGWVSGPELRGTSNILWSCFAVFLVCTWKCMHLNLPSSEESQAQWHKAYGWLPYWPTRLYWRVIFRQIKWMCIMAIAPEFGVAMAFVDCWYARELKRAVSSPRFTLTHAFYARMGGFVIAVPAMGSHNQEWETTNDQKFRRGESFKSESEGGLCFPLVTEEDINNQAKSDPFSKSFALLQCSWLIIQSIARATQGLQLTELELTTLAFTICAFAIYGLWWYKPYDAQRPIHLLCLDRATAVHIRTIYDTSLVFHTTALAFSATHLIAWNWEFPSPTIRILWRTFSLISTCGPLTLLFSGLFVVRVVPPNRSKLFGKIILPTFYTLGVLYAVSRLGLIVLIFYCFSSMPASVYQTPDWSNMVPHFS
ncbi:hypothetical protein BJX99DRAFT_251265 [Aspergillus californicus]